MQTPALMKLRGALALLLVGTVAVVGCSSSAADDEGDNAVAGAENAYTEATLEQLQESDPILKKLRAAATADPEAYEISVRDIATPQPDAYDGITLENGYATYGLDWFKSPRASYPDNKNWEQGSDIGKKCQWAAIFRFQKIFTTPPAEAEEVRANSTWEGSFWSWVDDYAAAGTTGEPTSSYAWSSTLWKWIGASGKDDTCRLPTRAMVVGMMKACLTTANANNRDAKGCKMPSNAAAQQYRTEAPRPFCPTAFCGPNTTCNEAERRCAPNDAPRPFCPTAFCGPNTTCNEAERRCAPNN